MRCIIQVKKKARCAFFLVYPCYLTPVNSGDLLPGLAGESKAGRHMPPGIRGRCASNRRVTIGYERKCLYRNALDYQRRIVLDQCCIGKTGADDQNGEYRQTNEITAQLRRGFVFGRLFFHRECSFLLQLAAIGFLGRGTSFPRWT